MVDYDGWCGEFVPRKPETVRHGIPCYVERNSVDEDNIADALGVPLGDVRAILATASHIRPSRIARYNHLAVGLVMDEIQRRQKGESDETKAM